MKRLESVERPKIITDIFNYKSKELYINLNKKDIPPLFDDPYKANPAYDDFYDWEEEKCKNGVNVNGVRITGALYYHLNWHTLVEEYEGEFGRVDYRKSRPQLWDNVWKIYNEYEKAQLNPDGKQVFMWGAARQVGKTSTLVSLACREAFLFENSETLGLFSSSVDKSSFTKKLNQAVLDKTNIFVKDMLDTDFKKGEIRFGLKQKDNEPVIHSLMYLYLTNEGNNSQVGAGKTVTLYFYDEVAKAPMKEAHEAVLPAIRGKFGLRTSPLLVFTGGEIESSVEAKNMFMNPVSNNVRPYRNGTKDTGYFMDATHRQDFKFKTTLSSFLEIEKGSELDEIPIYSSDVERALQTLEKEQKLAEQDTDSRTAIIKRIYDPLKVEDMFRREGGNPFSAYISYLEKHLDFIKANPIGRNIEVHKIGGVASWKDTKKIPIVNFPKQEYEDTDAAIVMYEPPKLNNQYFLHAGGLDPYNVGKTETSPSLGSFYLMRRQNSSLNDSFQDTMVLSYCARPERTTDYMNTLEAILDLYNGTMLHERSNDMVLQHFDLKNVASQYLCETWNLQNEINPQSEAKAGYGLAATEKNKEFCIAQIVEYLGEVIDIRNDKPVLGLTRILDPLLIEELIQYDVKGNFDRVLGFGHAIAYCRYLDKFYKVEEEKLITNKNEKKYEAKKTPFGFGGKSPYSMGRK